MRFLRAAGWCLAALPVLAAFVWCSLASRLPEPWLARRTLGDVSTRWTFDECFDVLHEPAHVLSRVVHLGLLHLPGAQVQWVAMANAGCALVVVLALTSLLRRSAGLTGGGLALACGAVAMLVCSPAFGADWLHGERLGRFLPTLLLLVALVLLARDGSLWWRGLGTLLLAALAPFCHDHGVLVFLALVPALAEATQRAGSPRRAAWWIALLLVGNLAAVASLVGVESLRLDATGLLGQFAAAPGTAGLALLRTTGSLWLDVLPHTSLDEVALGAVSWSLPLWWWFVGTPTPERRRAAAPWWSCIGFGLLLVLWHGERHGLAAAAGPARELLFGGFLLPIGVLGLVAAHGVPAVLPIGAGALLVLALQDWHLGLEHLRVARAEADRTEAILAMPASLAGPRTDADQPTRTAEQLQQLAARGFVPSVDAGWVASLPVAVAAPPTDQLGSCAGGDARHLHGNLRSRLLGDAAAAVVLAVATAAGEWVPTAFVLPGFVGRGRDVPWQIDLAEPLGEGVRVQAFGYVARKGSLARLGPTFVVRGGVLVAVEGP